MTSKLSHLPSPRADGFIFSPPAGGRLAKPGPFMLYLGHMESTALEQACLKAVSHFDVLNYPLTLLEIIRFSGIKMTAAEAQTALDGEQLKNKIAQSRGFYYLAGREKIIGQRLKRYRLARPKLKRALLFARLFSFFPWIRAVAIYSSLALKNSSAGGDIDLFFITAGSRLWSARFFANAFLKIFNLRPTVNNSRNKICASYWVSENALDLAGVNLNNDYLYLYGCAGFDFLLAADDLRNKFFLANPWLKDSLPNWRYSERSKPIDFPPLVLLWQKLLENIAGLIPEKTCQKFQLKILPQKYSTMSDGKKVVLSSQMIKLHDNDKREKMNTLFEENFKKILNI